MDKLIPTGVLDFLWEMAESWAADKGQDAHLIYWRMVAHHVRRAIEMENEELENLCES